ncbi:histidine kinase [Rhodoblastus acidophilus]|uniref:Oxygen sensor histidine kinase NreB n=1 Tax=Candidatus Rhodoblastus alkanivorans TaxID=2954117 RepID=A0ABS9Z349_9HYPH|nr:histidine kinase [Candidatus Rhodoblastus alkanivorans]MCI4677343.1 histidine kinase [Candidatus Rhodoblastus alkanivorans]MCI4682078.1 histidine kinase [Candidatus Rhodoblastus alkanivorans]MDI4639380.1 histidine kinase [Rhodoblastus acidophilus]
MSLKIRIDLLFGLVLLLGLAADIGRMAVNARARVQAESAAMTRVTRDFVEAAFNNFHGAPAPEASLRHLARSLDSLRHVRIAFVHDTGQIPAAALAPDISRRESPSWFDALIHARAHLTILPAVIDGRKYGDIVIASDPADEVNEVWQDVRNLALTGGAIALAALIGASFILGRTLAPLESCAGALGALRDGDYRTRVEAAGSPEFHDLCAKINALAAALQSLSDANRALIQRLMEVQEDERKRIARELHDEIGPYLFALRANASLLEKGLKNSGQEELERRVAAIRGEIESLQGHNKRILRQLRPPALDELGLCEALKILVDGWRETEPGVDIELSLPQGLDPPDEKTGLALYRLVQEALTNIYRHARATHASIVLSRNVSPPEIRVRVQDDGVGIDPSKPPGLGLTGMRERVLSLGGSLSFGEAPGGGGLVEAALPLAQGKDL